MMSCVNGIHLGGTFGPKYLTGMAINCDDAMSKSPSFNAFLLISAQSVIFGMSLAGSLALLFALLFELILETEGSVTSSLFVFCCGLVSCEDALSCGSGAV